MSLYFFGYHIKGEAGAWHRLVAKKISEEFKTPKIYEKAPSHITIYRPFIVNNPNVIIEVVRN